MTRGWKAALTGSVAVVGLLVIAPLAREVRERLYVRDNMSILDGLPSFPGSRERYTRKGSAYSNGKDPFRPPVGWSSHRVYAIPLGVRMRQVEAFYERELTRRGWRNAGLECDGYIKGQARVVVNAGGVTPRDPTSDVDVGVDAHGADEC